MLIPDGNGNYYFHGQKCIDYHAFIDGFDRVIELLTIEDGSQWESITEWSDMNDLEKHICRQRGWYLDRFLKEDNY